ncbi:MAG: hypothetical protein ABIP74_03070 [Candidatus Saccharimonas sp.]
MARDVELDRLKAAQDLAFNRQQETYQAQQRAWEQLAPIRERMNRAHNRQQQAYDAQQSSWDSYTQIKSSNGPRIDQLNAQQEHAFQNMRDAFDQASAAHDRRDGAGARSLADKGQVYKAESQGYVAERRRLVEEIRSARASHEPYQQAFQQAKHEFTQAKSQFDDAKARHVRAKADFDAAKAAHNQAKDAFRARLEKVRSTRSSDNRAAAERAGVPYQYRDNVHVSKDSSGNTNIYFGGSGTPDGPGHGHYVLDSRGKVTYKREPFDAHGAQNFTDAQRDYTEVVTGFSSSEQFGFRCRFRGYDAYVESNTNRQGRPKIDIYYGPNGPFGAGHHHAVAYRETPFDFVSDLLR